MARDGSEFFIVDNSDEHWKALEYVRQWCEISEAIDVATGHFEIGALLALDGAWQKVDHIRILIGGETSGTTASAIAAALDESFVVERAEGDPFLTGVGAVVEAIKSGRIEIRVYRRKKFHAKAYITHSRLDVVGSAALVGSSNFTKPGLTRNVELNVRFSGTEVRELQEWYESYWNDAEPVLEELLTVLDRNVREFSPFEVYAKALQALTRDLVPSEAGWEQGDSVIYPQLAPYQREAYHGLRAMAAKWNGGFLTDGVGLGKTFVGLMLAEYYAVKERKNVLIMATKTGQEAVWEPELKERLPDLAGGEFSNVLVMAHTDLSRQDAPEVVRRLRERVDVVIIDEGHNFRNHGSPGDDVDTPRSRWWRMQEICCGKTVFLLTATPVNNSLFDLVHQAEMFSCMDDGYFRSVGVSSLQRYVASLEKPFKDHAKGAPSVDLLQFEELMRQDRWLESIIWQNSRKYAVESAKLAGDGQVLFPSVNDPRVVNYQLLLHHTHLLDELEAAFAKKDPLFTLPMYYPLAFSLDEKVDTKAENRQRQVVGLIRTTFLKRFESSVAAFAGSCLDLTAKILVWLDANSPGVPHAEARLLDWHDRNDDLLAKVHDRYRPGMDMPDIELSDDLTEDELTELEFNLDPDEYDRAAMVEAAFEDLYQLGKFLERIADVSLVGDDKYDRLLELLNGPHPKRRKTGPPLDPKIFTPEFSTDKVLVFTEYADTARYLERRLREDGIGHVDRLDGTRKADRLRMIQRFAPHYNKVDAEQRKGLDPLRILVSTDVLSEGVNLQDAALIVNYDLHWNPVRVMQRIGRVDRRMNTDIEAAIVRENPGLTRGIIQIRNFLPPEDLERLLRLHQRVEAKVLMISKTLGIPGGRLLTEEDMLDDVKVMQAFKEEYEGSLSALEVLRLRFQEMLADDPALAARLDALPVGITSARAGQPIGVFACVTYPTLERMDGDAGESVERWTMTRPHVEWHMRTPDGIDLEHLADMDAAVRSDPTTPRQPFTDQPALAATLRSMQTDHLRDYRKTRQLPLDAPRPQTVCWMEVR